MFHVPVEYVKRVSFASKLFPRLRSAVGLGGDRLRATGHEDQHRNRQHDQDSVQYDGESFARGRSKNKDLLTFFGAIADPANGCGAFVQLPIFRRSITKLTHLVESELESLGAHQVLLPTLVPQQLWRESQRLTRQPDALDHVYKLTDRADTQLLLGPTYEESITCMVANNIGYSLQESDLPLLLYQTSNKFRYESNPKYGLLRCNEFLMNDLYSFDATLKHAQDTYATVARCYDRIFKRLGLDCLKIESNTGGIGGKYSHEYQLPVQSGQDRVIICANCNYTFNSEMFDHQQHSKGCLKCGSADLNQMQTLELGHIFLLSDVYSSPLSATYSSMVEPTSKHPLEMGCYGLGLSRIIAAGIDLLSITPTSERFDNQVQLRWPDQVEPYKLAIVTPARRSKQYQANSTEFAQRLLLNVLSTSHEVDIIVEDRDKDGIAKRIQRMQSLGVPNIVIIGNRFLQDTPEVELQKLDPQKESYQISWLTEDLLLDYIKDV